MKWCVLILLFPSFVQAQVVTIETENGVGAGIVLDSKHVLTCHHCVKDNFDVPYDGLKVVFPSGKKKATIIASDIIVDVDLALLRVDTEGPAIKICPLNDRPRASRDVISMTPDGTTPCKIVRESTAAWFTDFKAEPGQSGSALLNPDKQLVGVLKAREKNGNGAYIMLDRIHKFLDDNKLEKMSLQVEKSDVHWPGFITMWLMIGGGVWLVTQLVKKGA